MHTSNENDAKSISKLALIASAAATAAFLISQTRVLQRLTEPAPETPVHPPESHEPSSEESNPDEPVPAIPSGASQTEAAQPENDRDDDSDDRKAPPPSGSGRLRFRTARPARERLHYGLPVTRRRRPTPTSSVAARPATENHPDGPRSAEPTAVALLAPPVAPPVFDAEEFDPEYLAIVEAIARDGQSDVDVEVAEPVPDSPTAVEEMWWLPAPRLQYILAALIYVAISAAVGSDPVTLAAVGARALTTVNSIDDIILVGWVLCGFIVLIPLGALATRLVSLATRGRLYLPGVIPQNTIDSAGWGLRLFAVAAFVSGVVLYTPNALGWALNTDYPVAAVTSSSMSPALDEGELVLIEGVTSIDELRIGDIIAFKHDQGVAVRRITGFSDGSVLARADASPDEDTVVPFENIAGRVLTLVGEQVKLPLLGKISLLGERTVEPTAASRPLP